MGNASTAPAMVWASLAAGSLVVVLISLILVRRRLIHLFGLVTAVASLSLVLAIGALRVHADRVVPEYHVSRQLERMKDRQVAIEGAVTSFARTSPRTLRFDVAATGAAASSHERLRPITGRMEVSVPVAASTVTPEAGAHLRVTGRVEALPRTRNPADFDYGTFLSQRGISARMWIDDPTHVVVLPREIRLHRRVINALRRHVESMIKERITSDAGATVMRALLLGDRSGLSYDDRERLARSGLMHLLAVSGLHVFLIGMVFYQLLRPTLLRLRMNWLVMEWTRSIATITVLILYMLITGSGASVVRAVVMASIFIGATLAQRPTNTLNSLGAAAIVLLLARPGELFGAGFQLSFSAVAAIILFMPHIRRFEDRASGRSRAFRYVGNSVIVSIAASLGTLPVLLYHFGRTSFAGVVLNVAAIPTTFASLASGIAAVLLHGVWSFGADSFALAADALAQGLLMMAEIGDMWLAPTRIELFVRDIPAIACITAATLSIALWYRPRLRWRCAIAAFVFAGAGLWAGAGGPSSSLDVLFLDVGQGDAILVHTPNRRTLLVDAGPRTLTFDSGGRILAPNLAFLGVRRIDEVVVTHPHSDHMGGLPHLLRTMDVGAVWESGFEYDSALSLEVDHLLDSLGISPGQLQSGMTLDLDPQVRIDVLAPASLNAQSVNDASVVLRLSFGDTSFLLTGDAESDSEAMISRYYADVIDATLIKAGHHGSSTSSSEALVNRAARKGGWTVVSVAERNRYRHPSADVLERWRVSGRQVYLTSEEGAVWVRSDGKTIRRVEWR